MIFIVTAMYAEAHPFLTRFQLKKDISHTHFQVFLNNDADLCLIISGTGTVPAAVAVSSICTEYGTGQGDFLLNVGICAQVQSSAETPYQMGEIFLCNKIRELSTGKTFYPDILYRHMFSEAQIVTGAKPYQRTGQAETENAGFYLYDMEAAAIFQAGAYYFGPHQMSFLKVISDYGNTENVTPKQIEHLIDKNMDSLADYITTLQLIAHEKQQDAFFQEAEMQKELEKLCLAMHCSKVMSESVRQHIRYCILSGIDYASVLKEMYQSGKLPCIDKREGKQRFEELKERLL